MVVLKQKFCVLKTDATNAIYMCCAMQESLWVHLNFVEQKTLLRSDLLWGQNLFELEFLDFQILLVQLNQYDTAPYSLIH